MKKFVYLLCSGAIVLIFASCASKPMGALDPAYFTCNPNPLESNGGKINAAITGKFPEKYFDRKTVVTVTPVLKTSAGKEYRAASVSYQGEKVQGNNQQISYKAGGSYSQNASFSYQPDMAKSELYLEFQAARNDKTYTIPAVKVADGVIATETLASADGSNLQATVIGDKFQRVIQQKQDANIMFLIQQSSIRSGEAKKEEMVNLINRIQQAKNDQNANVSGLDLNSYASPDGGVKLNTTLAEQREKNTIDYINKQMKKLKTSVDVNSNFTAQDWEGFQQLMSSSNIQDKDVILRVLSMYPDPEQREREIKNMSSAYRQIAEEVLPQLRRSKMSLTVDVIGKTDFQIDSLAQTNPARLSVEELLYAATLTNDLAQKTAVYQKVINLFPNDSRGYNNSGVIKFNAGNYSDAASLFGKALSIDPKSPEANYNTGITALAQGDASKAQQFLGNAGNIGGDKINQALGIISLQQGDYAKAKSAFGNAATNNAALSQILTKDYSAARNTLSNVKNPNGATNYLAAVVGARTNDRQLVYDSIRKAVATDKSWATKALTDAEFAKYLTDSAFMNSLK